MPRSAGWKWITACATASLCFAVIPFAWQSNFATAVIVAGCLFPMLFALAVLFTVIWLKRNPVPAVPLLAGVLIVVVGVVFAFLGDGVARLAIFKLNYGRYRTGASSLMREPGSVPLVVGGYGVEGWEVVEQGGQSALKIETASGPTLQTVVFSPTPLTSLKPYTLRQVLKDDLGYWYFADPVRPSD